MADDREFRIRPGRIRSSRAQQARPFISQALAAAQKAGGRVSRSGRITPGNRSRFGRGQRASIQANRLLTGRSRIVVIKTRVVRHTARSAPLGAHLSYLRRDGVTRDGEKARLFGPESDDMDARAFAERCEGDRHHFRFIVSPEDAVEMADLRDHARELMAQMKKDLGTKLDWVGVDHWNTDNPHVHIILRGRTDDGHDLVISRDYIKEGMRARAQDLATQELGLRSDFDIHRTLESQVEAERWTQLDRQLVRDAGKAGIIDLAPLADRQPDEFHALKVGRLRTLEILGVAGQVGHQQWFIRPEAEAVLRELGERGDIIKRMHRALTLVVGPTGAGKSVLLALMAVQFRRYERSQVFAFDFGGSIRAAALAMNGDWHDLGGGLTDGSDTSVALQPLARIHDTYERAWAADWIVAILTRERIQITPDAKEHIWTALTSLASAPVGERTITGLSVLLQSHELKQALRPFCVGGPYGRLLDAEAEHLGAADVQAFEIEGLVGTGAAPAVLAYLFHRIGDRLDGRPTLLIIDEGWLALDDPAFSSQLREWLKTLRKRNASVIFATQSLSDIDNSAIAPAIIESCPTRLLLPNERAIEPQITAIYRRFGLNDRQIEILARATPKRDYYCQSRRGNRLFELGLAEVGLALCAASAKSDQTLIAQIVAEHGCDNFLAAWLEARDVGWATDLIPGFPTLIPLTEEELQP